MIEIGPFWARVYRSRSPRLGFQATLLRESGFHCSFGSKYLRFICIGILPRNMSELPDWFERFEFDVWFPKSSRPGFLHTPEEWPASQAGSKVPFRTHYYYDDERNLEMRVERAGTVARFRQRSMEVDAAQFMFGPDNAKMIIDWILRNDGTARYHERVEANDEHFARPEHIVIDNPFGDTMIVMAGDWVVRGIRGEYSIYKPDVFAAKYERSN